MPTAAERALEAIHDGHRVGLGTGRAATDFVRRLGERVEKGLRIQGVATSEVTARLATQLGIPLIALDGASHLDVTVDGADEVDPKLDAIKGYGGALVREKIVAASSDRLILLVGPEKLVDRLGTRGRLPVEVLPFGLSLAKGRLTALELRPEQRMQGSEAYLTDNGNYILDCGTGPIDEPEALEREILSIPGIVGTGLFLNMAETVLVERPSGVEEHHRSKN